MTGPDREPSGVAVRPVLLAVGGLALLLVAAAAAVWWTFPSARSAPPLSTSAFPRPRIETRPVRDYIQWAENQRARLAGAEGWMPIEEAMARIVARGPHGLDPVEEDSE